MEVAYGRRSFWKKIKEACTSPEALLKAVLVKFMVAFGADSKRKADFFEIKLRKSAHLPKLF